MIIHVSHSTVQQNTGAEKEGKMILISKSYLIKCNSIPDTFYIPACIVISSWLYDCNMFILIFYKLCRDILNISTCEIVCIQTNNLKKK